MVSIDVRIYRLFVCNRFIVTFNIYHVNLICVFCITFASYGFATDFKTRTETELIAGCHVMEELIESSGSTRILQHYWSFFIFTTESRTKT